MNKFLWINLTFACLFILAGCNDKNHYFNTAASANHAPTVVINSGGSSGPADLGTDLVDCEASPPTTINEFIRVQLTYGLLSEGPFIPGESGGVLPITITSAVSAGATEIPVSDTVSLVKDQLLTYVGTNDRYYVGQIKSITGNKITLVNPLVYNLAAGNESLWNFYLDPAHPNEFGGKALADFAFTAAFGVIQGNKSHVLLGDSWFKHFGETPFENRLAERLPYGSIINNEGIGGYSLCGLLSRIDSVLRTHKPDYVWINSSINDFFDEVTREEYKARMKTLIGKVQTAGATAIVMDPAPGILNQETSDGISFTVLSRRYSMQILKLLAETQ